MNQYLPIVYSTKVTWRRLGSWCWTWRRVCPRARCARPWSRDCPDSWPPTVVTWRQCWFIKDWGDYDSLSKTLRLARHSEDPQFAWSFLVHCTQKYVTLFSSHNYFISVELKKLLLAKNIKVMNFLGKNIVQTNTIIENPVKPVGPLKIFRSKIAFIQS